MDQNKNEMELLPGKSRSICFIICITLFSFLLLSVIIVLVIFPLIFSRSRYLLAKTMFTSDNSPRTRNYYDNKKIIGLRNMYTSIQDKQGRDITLGIWHFLPANLTKKETISNEEYDALLRNSTHDVLLYFHGVGQTRNNFIKKYFVLREYFHVIAFDYRSYGDSTIAELSEELIVDDSVQLFKWLMKQTNRAIFIWGHSLGAALSAATIAKLYVENIIPKGLILESAFTKMRDEIPLSPVGKVFAWLPWFNFVLDGYEKHGFIFDTASHILNVRCPIMLLHSEDDEKVPYQLGFKLFQTALNRPGGDKFVQFHLVAASYHCGHNYIYTNPNLNNYIRIFISICDGDN